MGSPIACVNTMFERVTPMFDAKRDVLDDDTAVLLAKTPALSAFAAVLLVVIARLLANTPSCTCTALRNAVFEAAFAELNAYMAALLA